MRFINCSYESFINSLGDKKVIQFGASSAWHYFFSVFPEIARDVVDKTSLVVDNSESKQGTEFTIGEKIFVVKRPSEILDVLDDLKDQDVNGDMVAHADTKYVILITVSLAYCESIGRQLLDMGLPKDTECYSLFLMTGNNEKPDNTVVDKYFGDRKERKIPAKIHCFWFSGEEKPPLYQKCLDSWHRFCPEFEIIEWNADNYDLKQNEYMYEAYNNRKWAFASDFARLDVLYEYGGIYMDMDVELTASLKQLLNADSFFCRQADGMLELGSGFGVQKGDELIGKMLECYRGRKLFLPDGNIDMTPQPEFLSGILAENGFAKNHNSQVIGDRLILSNDYICCYSGKTSAVDAKLGIHWHNGGWLSEKDRKLIRDSMEAEEKLRKEIFVD